MTIYLYVKIHNKTGLKYLGKTSQKDPYSYKGSGKRWNHHIKKHGYDVTTHIIKECESTNEIKHWGLHYSRLWNIVDDSNWANLREESGDGGAQILTDEYKSKISKSLKGREISLEHRAKLSTSLMGHTDTRSEEGKRRNAEISSAKLKGRKKPDGFGDKIRKHVRSRKPSDDSKIKMKNAWTPERRLAQAERCREQHKRNVLKPVYE